MSQSQVFSYNKADWVGDIQVSPQPEQITGKVLPAPQLRFGNNDLMVSAKYHEAECPFAEGDESSLLVSVHGM